MVFDIIPNHNHKATNDKWSFIICPLVEGILEDWSTILDSSFEPSIPKHSALAMKNTLLALFGRKARTSDLAMGENTFETVDDVWLILSMVRQALFRVSMRSAKLRSVNASVSVCWRAAASTPGPRRSYSYTIWTLARRALYTDLQLKQKQTIVDQRSGVEYNTRKTTLNGPNDFRGAGVSLQSDRRKPLAIV